MTKWIVISLLILCGVVLLIEIFPYLVAVLALIGLGRVINLLTQTKRPPPPWRD